jgi:iron complex transport system ATP-binding protein
MSGASWRRAPRLPARAPAGSTLAMIDQVSVDVGGHRAVHDVTLELRAGELVALVGPNGAGKSTLLGTLAGDLQASTGRVHIDGSPVNEWSARELAMRRAVLPQQVTVSFPFAVREVVAMGRAPWRATPTSDDDDAVVERALVQTDVAHLGHRTFPTLSGGERARVALARVVAQSSQLMLWDEPTAALDVHHQELVLALARDLAAEGAGVVGVLHDLGSAARWADRVLLLDRGRVVADGPPESVLEPSILGRVYGHRIDVLPHPVTGSLLVVPVSSRARPCPAALDMQASRQLLGTPNSD